jgi:predicted esterase
LVKDHGRLGQDIISGKTGRELAIEAMQSADILILLHGTGEECAEYIPSKFYDYLWAQRPMWAITHRNPQLDQMLLERNAYLSISGDESSLAMALEKIWLDWQEKNLNQVKGSPIGVDQAVRKILETAAI